MKKFVVLMGIVGFAMVVASCGHKAKQESSLVQEIAYENESMNNAEVNNLTPQAPSDITASTMGATTQDLAVKSNPTSKEIQLALKNAGIYQGKIDGSIGPKSKQAIREFQTQNGLKADGKVGPKTWVKLGPYLNQTTQSIASTATTQTAAAQNASLGE